MKVFLIIAMTADGYIARHASELADWTSKEDKKLFVELTKRAGVMVMGRNTFETLGRALPGRKSIVYTTRPLDVEGIETTIEAPSELIARLETEGYAEAAIIGGRAIYDQFLEAGVVTDIYLTIEPILFGDGVGFTSTTHTYNLTLKEQRKLNENAILLHYEVQN